MNNWFRHNCRILFAILFVAVGGCRWGTDSGHPVLRLATTTSTDDSGLLEYVLPAFELQSGCRVDVIAKGTGAALRLGESGDVDVLIVHARESELEFMNAGHGVRHEEFMRNHFVLLGPSDDPAGISARSPGDALRAIARSRALFVSRGDDSGTHKRELSLWDDAGGLSRWENYLEIGQGMGAALTMADEKGAYTLSDMGTYLRFQQRISLVPYSTRCEPLRNPYAAIVVDPSKHASIQPALANQLVDFLISDDAQRMIDAFCIDGQQLFSATRLAEQGD